MRQARDEDGFKEPCRYGEVYRLRRGEMKRTDTKGGLRTGERRVQDSR